MKDSDYSDNDRQESLVFSLNDIHADVRRTLLSNSDMTKLTAEFRALQTNAERVYFTYNLLKTHKLLPSLINVEKCDSKSEERRKYGNHVFVALKKDHVAMKHYNKSVAYAKSKETLALAYGNRSAVFYQNKLYKECIKDIEYAFENNYPEHLHEKLIERRKKAETSLSEVTENIEEYFIPLPQISGTENENIECASDSIEVKSTENMGRHIVATRNIEPGDVIAVENPYTNILLYEFYLTHCNHCLRPSYNLIPCTQCPLTLYCSETCRLNAWNSYHQFECSILDTLHSIDSTKLQRLALRIVLCARNEFTQLIENEEDEVQKYKSASYKEIHKLITNEEKRPVNDLFGRSIVAAVIFHLLESTTFFSCDFDDTDLIKKFAAGLLLHHLQTAPSNMHEISELQGDKDNGYNILEIGAGAYAFMSLLNHSCSPNVVRHCHGTTMVLRALRPIQVGQQLFDNYGYHHALMDREQRRAHLKDQYLFNCECEACVNDWPLYIKLSEGNNDFVIDMTELNELQNGSRQIAEKLMPFLVVNAKEFEQTELKNFTKILDNQEILKQCFAIFGNKHTLF